MPLVVGLRFREGCKIYSFDATGFEDLARGDYVVVETTQGRNIGKVVIPPREVTEKEIETPLRGIIRKATSWDLVRMDFYRREGEKALDRARELARKSGLGIKLIRAEYNFEGTKLNLYFTSEEKLNLKELAQALEKELDVKVEFFQIGVRDEAKFMGGIGPCGRILCCASFLTEFASISIKMAKVQDLPINPAAISGLCNRLLCCLRYEYEIYKEFKERLPKVGQKIKTPQGEGKITAINVIKETVTVRLENETTIEIPVSQVEPKKG
ncbi:MAG: regulatory iron-sulfur-containing complex subunit RicT [Anaerolineae bacterium]|nr:stage 0 sporulation family protein [Anaerolineae bacterium]MDW8102867.1 regulatory iron-sulfur-containing complex subunit RicT [Anaerolineae bacterium]